MKDDDDAFLHLSIKPPIRFYELDVTVLLFSSDLVSLFPHLYLPDGKSKSFFAVTLFAARSCKIICILVL